MIGASSVSFSQLADDVACKVMSFLDARSLCTMRVVNHKLHRLASKNASGWDQLCLRLWETKVHVSREAQQELKRSPRGSGEINDYENAMSAYKLSVLDGANRDHVTREELVFHPLTGKGTIWSFRFKEAAGSDWTAFDPWYNHNPCRKMVFLEDGNVKVYVPRAPKKRNRVHRMENDDDDDGETSSDMDVENGDRMHSSLVDPQYTENHDLQDPSVPMTWRFVTQPLDFPARPSGSYIRFSVMGREVPTYVCRRSPTNNWGFVMESCWGIYASFELPPRPREGSNSGIVRRRRRRQRRLRRSLNLQQGREIHFQVEIEDSSEDDDDDMPLEICGDDALVYDDNFNVTTEVQWREAFLYNNFAFLRLPEGSGALADFQRNYGV